MDAGGTVFDLRLRYASQGAWRVMCADAAFEIEVLHDDGLTAALLIDGQRCKVVAQARGASGWLDTEGLSAAFADLSDAPPQREDADAHGQIASRMHGLLVRLEVASGQSVRKGEFLLAIEAMKMEHRIEAPIDGTVVELGVAAGAQVAPGQLLLRIEAHP